MEFSTRIFLCALALSLGVAPGCGTKSNDKASSPPPAETNDPSDDGGSGDPGPDETETGNGDIDTSPDGDDAVDDGAADEGADTDTGSSGGGSEDGGNSGGGAEEPMELPTALIGTWKSENIPLSDPTSGDTCAISRVEFEATVMTAYFEEFYDTNCTDPKWTTRIIVDVTNKGSVAAPAGATALDYTLVKMSLRADSAAAIRTLNGAQNGEGFCGIDYSNGNWKKLLDKEGCDRDGRIIDFPSAGEVILDVFKINGNQLELGLQLNDEGTEIDAVRPTAFNDLNYTKQ